jgi:tricorn protease
MWKESFSMAGANSEFIPEKTMTWRFLPLFVIAVALLLPFFAVPAFAENDFATMGGTTDIVLPRYPAPSPDGSQIAFAYQGDIWIVPATGGDARRLTVHPAPDGSPIWSPDGRWIAFTSSRNGNSDIYLIPVVGGKVRRLTYYSGQEYLTGWTPDSEGVTFSGYRQTYERSQMGTFLAKLDGGDPVAIMPVGSKNGVISPDGSRLAYTRGSDRWWRRGYEGNARSRLWLMEMERPLAAGSTRPVTDPPRLSDRDDFGRIEPEDAARWNNPVATNAGIIAHTTLYPDSRHFNLTEYASDFKIRWADLPNGYLDLYLKDSPDFGKPEVETGANLAPGWFPDSDHICYQSEFQGVANLKILSITEGKRYWITRFKDGRLRFPRLSHDGSLVAFEYEDGIYTVALPSELPEAGAADWPVRPSDPKRLHIRLSIDAPETVERIHVSRGASELRISPDGDQIAFVCNHELFAMKASEDESQATRLTDTAARDGDIDWTSDSEAIIFTSDRSGDRDLYLVRSTDEDEKRLARSLHREITRLTDDERDEHGPTVSPDGKRIAYLRGQGTLMTMNLDGSDKQVIVDGWSYLQYQWSPDNRWFVYEQEDDNYNPDVWIVSADGKQGPCNISQHPDDDGNPYWSKDGKLIAFSSSRTYPDETDIWYVRLSLADEQRARDDRLEDFSDSRFDSNDEPVDEDDESENGDTDDEADEDEEEELIIQIDFEDIHKRLHRLTRYPGAESQVLVANDGDGFVFSANIDGDRDLWFIKWDGSEPKRITKGGTNPRSIHLDKKGKRLYFTKRGGTLASMPFKGGETTTYSYSSRMTMDRIAQRGFVFDEAWRAMNTRFYDKNFHGADWPALLRKYKPWALAASTYEDFQDVIKLLIGELNSSHQNIYSSGLSYSSEGTTSETGNFGVFFDIHHTGPGLEISHVVPKSAATRVESRLEMGEIIHSINGEPVSPETNSSRILDQTVGQKVILQVEGSDGERREVIIRPATNADVRELLYYEVLDARRNFVAQHGEGRLAYIHIDGMNEESLDLFERDLYAEANGKEALIIDVRGNGGGWTTDLMLTSLLAGDHAITQSRGSGEGYPQGRRAFFAWGKPVVVLCDEHSFSNAEIFSWANRSLGRAVVVGQRTAGGVISTSSTRLADGSRLRLPFRKWTTRLNGFNQEGTGCPPDYPVVELPGELARGVDQQLDRAVREALKQID